MKTSKFLLLGFLALGLTFTSCKDDDTNDDTPPPSGGNGDPQCETPTNLSVTSSSATTATLEWNSEGDSWTIEYGESGFALGAGTQVETSSNPFTIEDLNSNTGYDFYVRNNCATSTSSFSNVASLATPHILVGSWEAYDVSAVLAGTGVTGIDAIFRSNNTYTVISKAGESETVLEGTYATSESANQDGIYTITLTQTSPSTLTAEGIFKIYTASPDSMWYEVAQSEPEIPGVTPPTLEAGFGSTSGGAFATMNIQKYLRK